MRLAEQARSLSLLVGGLISPPVFIDGDKVGIDLVDQITGECRRLAVRHKEAKDGLRTDQWLFDPDVLAWGNRQLLVLPPCDIVILDELGPLELAQGLGLQAGLNLIDSRQFPLVVVVVRPKFLSVVKKRWPWGEVLAVASNRTTASGM
jgi:nucleoside-triphosphatase THEP1